MVNDHAWLTIVILVNDENMISSLTRTVKIATIDGHEDSDTTQGLDKRETKAAGLANLLSTID